MIEKETNEVLQAVQVRKIWSAPKMTVVDISDSTENMGNPGNDGSGTSTLS
ncbi:hypothetical protein [Methylomonas fluvii]|uniref:Uncharacterized protein n=1 Tax=Methylomonas fluvii TaxID=1854564 RepID=A0ABR9DJQ4_9GAMM|nr:hypothetical protein [Methylomonas fluvii]MBD9362469.1 hypothetical protein [Methylomonas fluvii]CAD6875573.1 hypothetical protein [Methylomonas fluvii]